MPWQEVMEQLDPSLEPMISKAVIKVGAPLRPMPNPSPKPNPSFIPHPATALCNRALQPQAPLNPSQVGNRNIMKLGDKEVANTPGYRFSLTTKLNNPHDTFEISTKVTYLYLRLTPHYLLSLTTYLEISPKLGSHQS